MHRRGREVSQWEEDELDEEKLDHVELKHLKFDETIVDFGEDLFVHRIRS